MQLNASHNYFIDIPNNLFKNMQNMLEIDFSQNQIKQLSKNSFDGSYKLKNVNISHNRVSILDIDTFWDLSALRILDLSYNLITSIEGDLFVNNVQLMEVHLQYNQIKSFEFKINYEKLIHLNMASNQLSQLNLTILSMQATNLEYLNLNENRLTHFDNVTRENFSKLSKLGISGNYILHENLVAFLKSWQHLEFIGNERNQEIETKSTNIMTNVFNIVFSICLLMTLAMKFKSIAQAHKKLTRKIKDAVSLTRYRLNTSTDVSDSMRSHGQYRKVED